MSDAEARYLAARHDARKYWRWGLTGFSLAFLIIATASSATAFDAHDWHLAAHAAVCALVGIGLAILRVAAALTDEAAP